MNITPDSLERDLKERVELEIGAIIKTIEARIVNANINKRNEVTVSALSEYAEAIIKELTEAGFKAEMSPHGLYRGLVMLEIRW